MTMWQRWRQRKRAPDSSEEETHIEGDRGAAWVPDHRSSQARLGGRLAGLLIGALTVGLLAWYYAHAWSSRHHLRQQAQSAVSAKAQGEMVLPALGRVEAPPTHIYMSERLLGPAPPLPDVNTQTIAKAPATVGRPAVSSRPSAQASGQPDRRLGGPVFMPAAEHSALTGHAIPAGPNTEPATASAGNSLTSLLTPTRFETARAERLPTQRWLVPKGSFIDCTLETAIDTSLPGLTTCMTATDTFGADGSVVLMERGTQLIGESRGDVREGMARVFVVWSQARTPDGIVVPLASPATDELGRAGLSGVVDRHFLDRFGAAVLISLIEGTIQAAVQSRSQGGTVIVNPTSGEDVLTEVLKSTLHIPPTLRKENGERVQVLVARDIDFRSVYALRPTDDAPTGSTR